MRVGPSLDPLPVDVCNSTLTPSLPSGPGPSPGRPQRHSGELSATSPLGADTAPLSAVVAASVSQYLESVALLEEATQTESAGVVTTTAVVASPPLECFVCKMAEGVRKAGSSKGLQTSLELDYYEYSESGWLMLGHCAIDGMVVVKEGPMVRQATSWTRIWTEQCGSGGQQFDVFVPACDDPSFVALGVIFACGAIGQCEPRNHLPVALVNKDFVEPTSLGRVVCSSQGRIGVCSVTLNNILGIGTIWPSSATLVGSPPQAHMINRQYWQRSSLGDLEDWLEGHALSCAQTYGDVENGPSAEEDSGGIDPTQHHRTRDHAGYDFEEDEHGVGAGSSANQRRQDSWSDFEDSTEKLGVGKTRVEGKWCCAWAPCPGVCALRRCVREGGGEHAGAWAGHRRSRGSCRGYEVFA